MTAYGRREAKVEPCPMCGRRNVRWRDRRFLDVVLNTLRHGVELLFQTVQPGLHRRQHLDPDTQRRMPHIARHEVIHLAHDHRWSSHAPIRYWRCPDCKQKGELFDDVETIDPRVASVDRPLRRPDDPIARR